MFSRKKTLWAAALSVTLALGTTTGAAAAWAGMPTTATASTASNVSANLGPRGAGALLSSAPIANLDPELSKVSATAKRITYRSESLQGKRIVVSGAVLTPKGHAPRGGWPVVSWAHGSSGVSDVCAPSTAKSAKGTVDLYGYGAFVSELLSAGYAVTATDYEGLGTAGEHPYIVADSEGRSVIDAVRAATQLDDHLSSNWVSMGHSQGGQAAIAAGELSKTWGKGLHFRGTVGLAPVTNVGLAYSYGSPGPVDRGFYYLALHGLKTQHPSLQYSDYLGPKALALMPKVEQECTAEIWDQFSKNLGASMPDYQFTPQSDNAALKLQGWLDRESEPRRHTPGPMLLLQGTSDPSIKLAATKQAVQNARDLGSKATFKSYPGKDHYTVLTPRESGGAADDVIRWLKAHD